MQGIAASPGIAIGEVYLKTDEKIEVEEVKIDKYKIDKEVERLHQALSKAKKDLIELKDGTAKRFGKNKAEIFHAHVMLLEDPELIPAIEASIRQERLSAESAVNKNIEQYAAIFAEMEDEYMRSRVADIQDIGQRVLKYLVGQKDVKNPNQKVIVVARDLSPSDTAKLDPSWVLAFVTQEGSATSHTAIMARSLGIPAVVGVGTGLMNRVKNGDKIIVDGIIGKVIINPGPEMLKDYQQKLQKYQQEIRRLSYFKDKKAVTRDGEEVKVVGNIGNLTDLELLSEYGGEGIGLFRTEFLYMERDEMPSEEEQFKVYRKVAEKMKERPVVIRTLDIGGDKGLNYIDFPKELNPSLGYRAIRFCLDRKEMFKSQLKAILRAANFGNIKIMYPMVSSLEEVKETNKLLAEVKEELCNEKKDCNLETEIGIMIETPAAAMIIDLLAKEVDFISIGTNDLIQYTVAVDRTNEKVADIYNPYYPAVLRLIKQIVENGHKKGVEVGMCGELAGDELLLPFLLGIGLDEFSMNAVSILRIKELLGKWTRKEAEQKTKGLLELETSVEVQNFLESIKR